MKKKLLVFCIIPAFVFCVSCKDKKNETSQEVLPIIVSSVGDEGSQTKKELSEIKPVDWIPYHSSLEGQIPLELEHLPSEPQETDTSPPDDLFWEIADKNKTFVEALSTTVTPALNERFIGTWFLNNEQGDRINGYDIDFDIRSWDYKGEKLYLGKLIADSPLYFSDNGNIYVWFGSMFGVLYAVMQIKIYDNQLYFYIVKGDKWVLDPVHEGGKYFYVKYPLREKPLYP